MNKKLLFLIVVVLALVVLIFTRKKISGYDAACNRTVKEGAMCYNSSNKVIEPAVTDVASCCNTEGNRWQLASQIE